MMKLIPLTCYVPTRGRAMNYQASYSKRIIFILFHINYNKKRNTIKLTSTNDIRLLFQYNDLYIFNCIQLSNIVCDIGHVWYDTKYGQLYLLVITNYCIIN